MHVRVLVCGLQCLVALCACVTCTVAVASVGRWRCGCCLQCREITNRSLLVCGVQKHTHKLAESGDVSNAGSGGCGPLLRGAGRRPGGFGVENTAVQMLLLLRSAAGAGARRPFPLLPALASLWPPWDCAFVGVCLCVRVARARPLLCVSLCVAVPRGRGEPVRGQAQDARRHVCWRRCG